MNWLSSIQAKQTIPVFFLLVSSLSSSANDIYVTTSAINVRTGPGTEHQVAFILQKGEEVEVLLKIDSWYQIRYMDRTGYVHSNNLQFSRAISVTNLEKPQQIVSFLLIGAYTCLALFVGSIVFIKIRDRRLLKSVTRLNRGTKTERDLVLLLLKYGIPAEDIFHDLYLEKGPNDYAQIDLVAITKVGIIVFEVKNYSGWIFGRGNEQQWTQVLSYGKEKYRIYNPIMQNKRHMIELRQQLASLDNMPYYSCVVFFGDCVLKEINFVPSGIFLVKADRVKEVLKVILKDNLPVHYSNRAEIGQLLQRAVTNGGFKEIRKQHEENIKDMLGKHRIFD